MGLFGLFGIGSGARKGTRLFAGTPASLRFVLDGAAHTYDDGHVGLRPTSLEISERRVAVVGLNGSGKTTLLQLLDGAITPTAGTIRISQQEPADGQVGTFPGSGGAAGGVGGVLDPSVKADRREMERQIGRVRREELPESFYRAATVSDALIEPLKKLKVKESERLAIVRNLLGSFELSGVAAQPANRLSGEQRHLLAVVAALVTDPACVVADEPTKGLDEPAAARVSRTLFGFDRQLIIVTHDLDVVRDPKNAIERVIVLDEGMVAFDGKPAEAVDAYEALIRRKLAAMRG